MRKFTRTAAAALLLLFGAAGCADLEVANPNDPDRERALESAGDVESLIAGSFNTWFNGVFYTNAFWASNASFQSAASAANFGNIDHSPIPRQPVLNDPAYEDYGVVVERTWQRAYRALAAAADGIRTLDNNPDVAEALEEEERARAWAKAVQGLAHATLAIWYDQAFILDETTDLSEPQTAVSRDEVFAAAVGYFEEAITAASGADWDIPTGWLPTTTEQALSADEFAELLYSYRAIFRASMPRSPSETVDWDAVVSDLDNGITSTVNMDANWNGSWYDGALDYTGGPHGWGADTYFVIGMADQSGRYQDWLDRPVGDRQPWFGASQGADPFIIITPDTRFPQGATLQAQIENPGEYYAIPTEEEGWAYTYSEHMENAGRGTWRWSYYYYPVGYDYWFGSDFTVPLIKIEEVNLLRAEALLADGQDAAAAAIIDQTRTAYGLDSSADGNDTCVPRLPNAECGDLMEMLKWEKRLETRSQGAMMRLSWYFDGRRWGDLYEGTPLQLPVPATDLQLLGLDLYTFGGVNGTVPGASEGSSYAYPGEN